MKRPSLIIVLFVLTCGLVVNHSNQSFAQSSCQSPNGEIIYRRDGTYYRMNPDGRDIQKLPNTDLMEFTPVWSPDGSKIAFMSPNYADLSGSIYVMDADGNHLQKIVDVPLYFDALVWSPDGTQLAFSVISEGVQVAVIGATGKNLRQLTSGRQYIHLVGGWSLDGTQLVISNSYETSRYYLSVADLESGTIRNLTTPENNAYDYFVGWTLGGDILFNSNRMDEHLQLLKLNPANGEIQLVFDDFAANSVWSPDKTQLAFIASHKPQNPDTLADIFVFIMDIETGNVFQVTSEEDRLNHENFPVLTWSPDGTQLAFESSVNGKYEIFKINVDGTNMTQLTFDGGTNPIWRPCP